MRSHKTGTIAFSDQNSLARLNTGTTVLLTRGSGSIAQLVVDQGAIWGRVLTSTGINFGTDGFIVGVRGTSIALSKNATHTQLAIVDSTQAIDQTAAVITCRAASDSGAFYRGTQTSAKKYSTSTVPNAVCLENLTQSNPAQIYASQNWIRANTLKDIEKMSALATREGAIVQGDWENMCTRNYF